MSDDKVTISKKEYEQLLRDRNQLREFLKKPPDVRKTIERRANNG